MSIIRKVAKSGQIIFFNVDDKTNRHKFISTEKYFNSQESIKLESDEKVLSFQSGNNFFRKGIKGSISKKVHLRHIKAANNFNTARELAKKKENLRDVDTIKGKDFLPFYKEATKKTPKGSLNRLVNQMKNFIRNDKSYETFDTKHIMINRRTGNPVFIKSQNMVNNDNISNLAGKQKDFRDKRDKYNRGTKGWNRFEKLRFQMGEFRYKIWQQLYNEIQFEDLDLDDNFILG